MKEVLQKKLGQEYNKQRQHRNTQNELGRKRGRLAKLIGKLYEHFGLLLLAITRINVADTIRVELLHYLLQSVFDKIINTLLVCYGFIVGIDLNQCIDAEDFDFNDNVSVYKFGQIDRYNIVNGIFERFVANDWSETKDDQKYSLLAAVQLLLNNFENILEITNNTECEWKSQLESMNEISKAFENVSGNYCYHSLLSHKSHTNKMI